MEDEVLDGCVDRLGVAQLVSSVIECSCSSKERIGLEGFFRRFSSWARASASSFSLFFLSPQNIPAACWIGCVFFLDPGVNLLALGLPGLVGVFADPDWPEVPGTGATHSTREAGQLAEQLGGATSPSKTSRRALHTLGTSWLPGNSRFMAISSIWCRKEQVIGRIVLKNTPARSGPATWVWNQVRDLGMNILQGFLSVMMGYGQGGGYINLGVYQREFVLYLRYQVENGVYGILPSLSRVSKQLGRVLGDLSVFSYFCTVFSRLTTTHRWTDRLHPATDNIGGTINESSVIMSRFPKGPTDDSLNVEAGIAVGSWEGLGYCLEALKHLPVRLRNIIMRILGHLGIPFPSDFVRIILRLIGNSFWHLFWIRRAPRSRPTVTARRSASITSASTISKSSLAPSRSLSGASSMTSEGSPRASGLGRRGALVWASVSVTRRLDPNPLSPSEWELAVELELPADPVLVHTGSSVPRPRVVTFNSDLLGRRCFFFFLRFLSSSGELAPVESAGAAKSGLGFGQSLGSRGLNRSRSWTLRIFTFSLFLHRVECPIAAGEGTPSGKSRRK